MKESTNTGPKTAAAKKAPAKKAPGKAVAKVTKPEEKSEFTPAKAKAHTEKIKKSATSTFDMIVEAYKGRIWLALDHKSWDEYCDKEFEGVPLALPREKKKQAIQALRSEGKMSTRAIAAATGTSQSTVSRNITDPAPTESNGSVASGNVIDVEAEEVPDGTEEFVSGTGEPEPQTVVGTDGREMNVSNIGKQPAVVNIVSAARTIAKDLEAVRIRLDSLLSRDDYEENSVAVQGTLETAVGDFIDTLVDDFADLISERLPETEPV